MSGVFMDGGSGGDGGGGGYGHHSSGGDGGAFMDGGGHDHGHHGHAMHGGGGDGGNFLNHVLGYNNNNGHHSFLSHLLGLDHDAHHHGGHGDGGHGDGGHDGGHGGHGDGGQNPSQTPIWTSALQGMKLSHALEGIKISINVWFFFFYVACISWLFVIYWLRHHEPLANAVLGRGAAKYETAAADRRIIDNCRDATPLRTSQTQAMYAPMPAEFHDPNAQLAIKAAAFNPNTASQPYFAPTNFTPPNATPVINVPGATAGMTAVPSGAGTRDMASFYNQSASFGTPVGAGSVASPQVIPNANGPGHMIATPMPLAPGAQRLKMIINR